MCTANRGSGLAMAPVRCATTAAVHALPCTDARATAIRALDGPEYGDANGLAHLVAQRATRGCRGIRRMGRQIRWPGSARVRGHHGRGPPLDPLMEARRCSGARIAGHGSQPHAAVSHAAVDLMRRSPPT